MDNIKSGFLTLIPPTTPDCVVSIGVDVPGGIQWIASGFFYGNLYPQVPPPKENLYNVYLITNKHVFDAIIKSGSKVAHIRVNPKTDEKARTYNIELFDKDGNQIWYLHPNPKVDVAVVPINFGILKEQGMQAEFFQSDIHVATTKEFKEIEVTEGDFIYTLGFPMNLVGDERNTVIVRGGVIARVSDVYKNPHKAFLIDSPVFPGNSGGPVILKPEMITIQGTKTHNKVFLIGVVSSYIPYEEEAVSRQTGKIRITFQENSGLTLVYTVDCIQEAIQEHIKRLALSRSP